MSIIKNALSGFLGLGLAFSLSVQSASANPPLLRMGNPASANCVKQGGKLEIVTDAQGGQSGYCTLPNGVRCEEWALLRNECPAQAKPPIVGGYSAVSVKDAQVQAAARFAADQISKKKAKLAAVNSAEAQVVAGMNYRMKLTLSDRKQYQVVVFRSLDGRYKLSSATRMGVPAKR